MPAVLKVAGQPDSAMWTNHNLIASYIYSFMQADYEADRAYDIAQQLQDAGHFKDVDFADLQDAVDHGLENVMRAAKSALGYEGDEDDA